MIKVVVDENIPFADEYFSGGCSVVRVPGRTVSPEELADADALIIRSVTRVSDVLLCRADKLSFVGTCTIGTDHVDQKILADRGIKFFSAPGCNRNSVGEYIISAIFVLARRYCFDPAELSIGIIGAGNTGTSVMNKALALGMKVRLYDPYLDEAGTDPRIFSSFEEALSCDIVTFHVPLTRDGKYPTYHLLDKDVLDSVSDSQILLNASRGDVWDNRALLERMNRGSKLRFVLDVWEHEPKIIPGLIDYTELATPHIAGYSLEGKLNGTAMIARQLSECFGLDATLPDPRLVLPAADCREITVDGEITSGRLMKLIHLVYNVERDDGIFRCGYTDEKSFDRMRKNYPVRREWSSLKVKAADSQRNKLKKLGFDVDE